jgi:hypothetical protein
VLRITRVYLLIINLTYCQGIEAMDLFARLKKYLAKGKAAPWPYGLCGDPSERAMRAWEVLGGSEKLMISCHSPFVRGRYCKLAELYRQGLSLDVLNEISGVSRSTLSRNLPKLRGRNDSPKE